MGINNEQLATELASFIGTTQYYRITNRFIVTEGVKYLADQASCYWLLDLYASHLVSIDHQAERFTVLKMVRQGRGAYISIEDGNDRQLASQVVEYTDFPLPTIQLYACWDGQYWVAMLPSEY